MRAESLAFFTRLLEAPGPTGGETAAALVWREYADAFADVSGDALGSSFARVGDGAPRVIVMGHVDEIGIVVNHVDDEGYLWFGGVGGWDPQILTGQRVRILGADGPVGGVIGRKAAHLTDREDREKASKIKDLWIDIGAADAAAARARVRPGDLGVLEHPVLDLGGGRLASRAVDNRCGAFVAAESARLYAESPGDAALVGVASVGEETAFTGAYTSAYALEPDAAIIIDGTHATDHPTADKRQNGDVRLGRGPAVTRGAGVHAALVDAVIDTAEEEGIPVQVESATGRTHTDADAVHLTRAGVPCAVVSVPVRYMHSPNELLDTADLEACARLVTAVVRRLDAVPTLG